MNLISTGANRVPLSVHDITLPDTVPEHVRDPGLKGPAEAATVIETFGSATVPEIVRLSWPHVPLHAPLPVKDPELVLWPRVMVIGPVLGGQSHCPSHTPASDTGGSVVSPPQFTSISAIAQSNKYFILND
jgi:hypothetical protein